MRTSEDIADAHCPIVAPRGWRAATDGVASPLVWLHQWARESPDRVVATGRSGTYTYRELADLVVSYAACVQAHARTGAPVALFMSHSPESFAALLGVMQSGVPAVPLDPHDGRQRARRIIAVARPGAMIVSPDLLVEARTLVGDQVPILVSGGTTGTEPSGGDNFPVVRCPGRSAERADDVQLPDADAAALLLFTSGSTGTPKGFVDTHASLAHFGVSTVNELRIGPGDRISQVFALSFGAARPHAFAALCAGATLVFKNLATDGIVSLAPWLSGEGITHLHTTPNVLRTMLLGDHAIELFRRLRVVVLGGDRTLPADLERGLDALGPDCQLVVSYASTDTGLLARSVFDRSTERPITAVSFHQLRPLRRGRVVDDGGAVCAAGTTGHLEFSIAAPHPFAFQPQPQGQTTIATEASRRSEYIRTGDLGNATPDGDFEITGRSNDRVKVRGFGVDLVEVETAVACCRDVVEAAVVLEQDESRARLVAHIVTAGGTIDVPALRTELESELAHYMVPTRFVSWPALPLTTRGKVDRAKLAAGSPTSSNAKVPSDDDVADLEQRLLAIWREALGSADVGLDDAFFDAGGDSLLAYELVITVGEVLDVELPPTSLLAAPTVRQQAAMIRSGAVEAPNHMVQLRVGRPGVGPVLFLHGIGGGPLYALKLLEAIPEDRPVYSAGCDLALAQRCANLEELAAIHTNAFLELTEDEGPVALFGWSFGGVLGWEMAPKLQAAGRTVEVLVLGDTRLGGRKPDPPSGRGARFSNLMMDLARAPARLAHLKRSNQSPSQMARSAIRRRPRLAARNDRIETSPEGRARKDTLKEMAAPWTPGPCSVPVAVIAAHGSTDYHRAAWGAASSGPLTIEEVPFSSHMDLMTYRRAATIRVFGSLLGRSSQRQLFRGTTRTVVR